MNKPRWILQAENHIGVKEVKGATHNPVIVQFWKDIRRGGIRDDETPWCAAFVGAMLERCGIQSTRFESAKSYLSWGEQLDRPVYGCVVVFSRDGGGHVGFVVGKDKAGNLLVLGGNQGDAVNVKAFPLSRVTGYRWPQGEPLPVGDLPVGDSVAMSRSEA
ncbi:TIGR02594 family protein [Aeromonas dhakensis]|uniref:TIGR02594 family protein n=1 Tax=Aeromonas dhakensis TaxID=196024 RepID=UPI0038D24A69